MGWQKWGFTLAVILLIIAPAFSADTVFQRRQQINLSAPTTGQILLQISLQPDMQPASIRFSSEQSFSTADWGASSYSYWIEQSNATTISAWVNLPTPTSSLYLYFSPLTPIDDASSGEATFPFFDDFLSLDSAKWTQLFDSPHASGNISASNSLLTISVPADNYDTALRSIAKFSPPFILEAKLAASTIPPSYGHICLATFSQPVYGTEFSSCEAHYWGELHRWSIPYASLNGPTENPLQLPKIVGFTVQNATYSQLMLDRQPVASNAIAYRTIWPAGVGFQSVHNQSAVWDWILVRSLTAQPAYSIGPVEGSDGTIFTTSTASTTTIPSTSTVPATTTIAPSNSTTTTASGGSPPPATTTTVPSSTCTPYTDGVCPASCTVYSDRDCCDAAGMHWSASKGCFTTPADTTTVEPTSSTIQPNVTTTAPAETTISISETCPNGCADASGNCVPVGIRTAGKYCSLNRTLENQSIGGSACDNSFECSSNVCLNGACVEPSFIDKIIQFLMRLLGLSA